MGWSKLSGQNVARRILENQLRTGQLSHAYLFLGAATAAKQAAVLLAQAANCGDTAAPCGSCTSCRQIEQEVHPDLRWVRPDGASIRLQQIKNLVSEAVLTPNVGPYRIFIIDGAERLTREAANALLLILEEPPQFDLFILLAAAPLLPTIESRCQVLRFQDCAEVADEPSGDESDYRSRAAQLLAVLAQTAAVERAQLVDELEQTELDLPQLLGALLQLYRDLMVWQVTQKQQLLLQPELLQQLPDGVIVKQIDFAATSRVIFDSQRRLQHNVNKRLTLEYLLYSLP